MPTLGPQETPDQGQATANKQDVTPQPAVTPYDFRRPDRIPKSQLNVVQFLHEGFIRTLASSLSLYLRSYVSGTLVRVNQMTFGEFVDTLELPTCAVYLSMLPYDGNALISLDLPLLAPILDHVLGGNGKIKTDLKREITDVEENMLEGLFRVIAHDLSDAWKLLVPITFAVDSVERKPQLSKRIARDEGIVTVEMELRVGDSGGLIILAIPSITLKMLHQRFDQQSTARKAENLQAENAMATMLADQLQFDVDLALPAVALSVADLLDLEVGKVIDLGIQSNGRANVLVNGVPKFVGRLSASEGRRGLTIDSPTPGAIGLEQ